MNTREHTLTDDPTRDTCFAYFEGEKRDPDPWPAFSLLLTEAMVCAMNNVGVLQGGALQCDVRVYGQHGCGLRGHKINSYEHAMMIR